MDSNFDIQGFPPVCMDTARTDSYFVEAVMVGKMIGRVFVVIVSCQSHFSNPAFSSTIPFIHKTPFFLQILPRGSIPALTTASPRAGSVLDMFSRRRGLDTSHGMSTQREQFSWGDSQNGISLKWGIQKSMPFYFVQLFVIMFRGPSPPNSFSAWYII